MVDFGPFPWGEEVEEVEMQPWVSVAAIEEEAWKLSEEGREEFRRILLDRSASRGERRVVVIPAESATVSDGYHTFAELYEHRMLLTAFACRALPKHSWRSMEHHPSDGPMYPGYFIVGFDVPHIGQISYHYPVTEWNTFDGVRSLPHAPRWDGHTPEDVVSRMREWLAS